MLHPTREAFEFHMNFFGHSLRRELDEERPCAKLKGVPFSGPKIGPQLVVDFPSAELDHVGREAKQPLIQMMVSKGNDPPKRHVF